MTDRSITCDVLVIGAGAAGCFAAIKARQQGADTLIVSKGVFGRDGACTWMAGPAIQAALYPPDTPETHAADVIRIGRYLADQELVLACTRRLPEVVRELDRWGVRFERSENNFTMVRYPGETYPRVANAALAGSFNGPQYRRVLPRQVLDLGIRAVNDVFVSDLLVHDGTITGAVGLDIREGKPVVFQAKSVVLATGGHMGCYSRTIAPTSTGDGNAMAYRAGVELADMEFTDHYAYVTVWPPNSRDEEWPAILIYELGAKMYNRNGVEFMHHYSGAKRVPPRALALEIRAGRGSPHGGVYLSLRHLPKNLIDDYVSMVGQQRWLESLRSAGFDIHRDGAEIAPAAITSFGGCKVNFRCETNLSGLYAAGEVASGHQGAYVMVGNMAGTSMAMGCIAGEQAAERAKNISLPETPKKETGAAIDQILKPARREGGFSPAEVKARVHEVLDKYAYLVGRTDEGMTRGLAEIEAIKKEMIPGLSIAAGSRVFNMSWWHALEAANEAQIAELILLSARARTESRGCHYRDDYPEENPDWIKRTVVRREADRIDLRTEPVALNHVRPLEETD